MLQINVKGLFYPVYQINGQRITGPPSNWIGDEPSVDNEVYVTNMPRELFEDVLMPLFSKFGTVYKFRLMMCFSGKNRGFGYIHYTRSWEAEAAVKGLFNLMLPFSDRPMFAYKSTNKRVLLMVGISPTLSDSFIMQRSKVLTLCKDVYPAYEDRTQYKIALLHYETHREAAMARRNLQLYLSEFGEHCFVKWYQ